MGISQNIMDTNNGRVLKNTDNVAIGFNTAWNN